MPTRIRSAAQAISYFIGRRKRRTYLLACPDESGQRLLDTARWHELRRSARQPSGVFTELLRFDSLRIVACVLARFFPAQGAVVFTANLDGAQEVLGEPPFLAPQPGIETETAGRFRIRFDRALTKAQFRLRVDQGTDITQAQLHCAPAGVNGQIAVFLFDLVPDPGVDVSGLLSEGELTNDDFEAGVDCTATCGNTVNNIASLRAAILDGCIYANVHSVANRGGEVRGQLIPKDDD